MPPLNSLSTQAPNNEPGNQSDLSLWQEDGQKFTINITRRPEAPFSALPKQFSAKVSLKPREIACVEHKASASTLKPLDIMSVGKLLEFIELPHGGAGAGFHVPELIAHIRSTGRDYIIQGQQNCTLADHTKLHSLDVWLRKGFTSRKDTKQAVNQVIEALVATGRFGVGKFRCPDSKRLCKGVRVLDPS